MRIIILVSVLALTTGKRVQLRPRVSPQIYYENEDTQLSAAEDENDARNLDEVYAAVDRASYQQRGRALLSPRTKEEPKLPPVQTIRNYNKVNDDGSFTFGYEAADGSFKEETRGVDCVVRGKYGYVDPDGNRREFAYVSGNPCDPNAPKEDDDELNKKQQEDEEPGFANYPSVRPVPTARPSVNYPRRTTAKPAPTTLFQTEYHFANDDSNDEADEEVGQELKEANVQQNSLIRPTTYSSSNKERQNYLQIGPIQGESLYVTANSVSERPRPTTPAPSYYKFSTTPSSSSRYQSLTSPTASRYHSTPSYIPTTTARPAPPPSPPPTPSSAIPHHLHHHQPQPQPQQQSPVAVAITPRPHLLSYATERPGVIYAKQRPTTPNSIAPTPSSIDSHLNFAAELERYVNTVPAAASNRPISSSKPTSSKASYQSELVYDPSSGQYNTQLYQNLPQSSGDFQINQKLQPYVLQSDGSILGLQRVAAQRPAEAIYRQQQTDQFLQSQQLFAQQQRRQQQQQQQQQQHQLQPRPQSNKQYYVSSASAAPTLTLGQIDQFLRGSTTGF